MKHLNKAIATILIQFIAVPLAAAASGNTLENLVIGNYEHKTAHCNIYASKGGNHLLFIYSNSERGLCSHAGESELFELTSGGGGGRKYFVSVRPEYEGNTRKRKYVRIIGNGTGFLICNSELDAQKAIGSTFELRQ
jgi:hypothetical protein